MTPNKKPGIDNPGYISEAHDAFGAWHYGEEHGWDSLEDEQSAIVALMVELQSRLEEVEVEIKDEAAAEDSEQADAKILLQPIPANVESLAAAYYASRLDYKPNGWHGLVAFCRHRFSNYDALLADLRPKMRDVLLERVNAEIKKGLEAVGIEEYSLED